MTGPVAFDSWIVTRDQLVDAISDIKVRGTLLPGRADPVVCADDMADAILSQLTRLATSETLPAAAVIPAAIQHAEYRGWTAPEPEDMAIAEDMLKAALPAICAHLRHEDGAS